MQYHCNNTPSGGISVLERWLAFATENGSCLFSPPYHNDKTKKVEEW
jgi:hypothetical protein